MQKKISVEMITVTAMLIAAEVVLSRFCSINSNALKIGFGFVPIVIAAVIYGPVTAGIAYGLSDLIGALLFPIGPYFPGFTACAALMGVVYGLFLHNQRVQKTDNRKEKLRLRLFLTRILPPTLINSAIGLFLNTIWVSILYSKYSYWGWFAQRITEYAILIPLNLVLIPVIIKLCETLRLRKR